jgi:Peptidase family M23
MAFGLLFTLLCGARADEFRTPAISVARPDWQAAARQLQSEISSEPRAVEHFNFTATRQSRLFRRQRFTSIAQLNAVTSPLFPGVGLSSVPVLLPFDSAQYLADQDRGATNLFLSHYQAGFRPVRMFDTGPAGYDAVFALEQGADDMPPRIFVKPIEVQITGSLLTYDINDHLLGEGVAVKSLEPQFPDLRRLVREGYVRYAFTRFGVPYVVSIACHDGPARSRRLSCREASPVAERFLKALRVAGGSPRRPRFDIASEAAERPIELSPDFTYHPPGEIIANSGYRGQAGRADFTAYSQTRFPLEKAPAFANSQSFMNWGDCYQTGRVDWSARKGDHYHCKRNDKPLVFDESAKDNYSYPWQDNFCETRDFEVGQCANGMGHQGQDIRPSSCQLRNDGADRCMPNIFGIVAVRDGVLIRAPGEQAVYLLVNDDNEHIRFRYVHMNPARMDEDGVLHGRRVSEGEKIGLVSNFQDHAGGTTSHLHFDIQVFTRDGWIWVNPYTTLISAYERLIGGRGREYIPPPPAAPAIAHATLPDENSSMRAPNTTDTVPAAD